MIHIARGTMGKVVSEAMKPDYNVIIPAVVSVCASLLVLFALWDRVKKCFPAKAEFDSLQKEVHELRLEVATLRKIDGKLDKILEAAGNRKGRND